MSDKKVKVVTYIRTKHNTPESVLSKEEEELKELLERHKAEWDVVENVVDYGDGGRKYERAGLNRVIELCRNKEVNMVVTLNSEMLSRDVLVYKKIYKTFRCYNVELYINELKRVFRRKTEKSPELSMDKFCPALA